MEAALRLGRFAQPADDDAAATDQACAAVAQSEKAVSRARRNGALEYWSLGETGRKSHARRSFNARLHDSITPLIHYSAPSPQFRGLIFPAQTTPSPHEKLFSLRRSVRLL